MSHRGEEGEGPGEGGRGEGREEEEGEEEWKEGRRRIIREIAGQSHTLFCVRIRTAVTCQEADTLIHRDTMTCQLPSGEMREKRTELELCPDQNYARASGSRGLWNGTEGEGSGFSVGGLYWQMAVLLTRVAPLHHSWKQQVKLTPLLPLLEDSVF